MEIAWKVYLTEVGYQTRCNCREFEGEHSLGRHYVINRSNIFDSSEGYCMEVYNPDECGGSVDLIEHLKSLGISMDNVMRIDPENLSDEDHEINEMVRRLEAKGILPVFDIDDVDDVYIVPAVQEGGLVEYQVSNGLPDNRNTSIDVYSYSEAKRIFTHLSELGWSQGATTI